MVGGGLVGAATAYVLAKAGVDVVLLEAARIAREGTAAGLGVILPDPDATFRGVDAVAGLRVTRAAWRGARRSAIETATLLRRLSIKCDLRSAPFVRTARSDDDAKLLKREQAARKAAGLDAPWLTPSAGEAALGTDSAGAIRLRESFTFDPVRATIGLVRAAESAGARVFEQSPVRRTRFTRNDADVVLAKARIRTRGVVVATGAPGTFCGQLRRHVRAFEGYVVVTEPFTPAMRREAGRRDSIVTEAGVGTRWLRWLADGRAMFGGAVSKPASTRLMTRTLVQRTGQLMYELSLRYPVMSGLPARWSWPVPVVSTADGLPWIGPHRNYPFHFFSLAFGWHGDGLAWHAARAALHHFRGETTKDDEIFGFGR